MGIGKYIAAFIAVGLMAWTWSMANTESEVGLDKRRAIEATLEETIVQYIKTKKPTISDVVFQQLYSEDVAPKDRMADPGGGQKSKEMLVRFRYLTNEPAGNGELTEQVFEGSVRLRSKDGLTWEWIEDDVHSPILRYKRGSEIRPNESQTNPGSDPAK